MPGMAKMEMAPELARVIPEMWLAGLVLVLFGMGPFLPARRKGWAWWLALGGLLGAFVPTLRMLTWQPQLGFDGAYAVDPLGVFFKLLLLATTVVVLLASRDYFRGMPHEGDIPGLLVLLAGSMILLASSNDLVLIALFVQLVSITSYVLVGVWKDEPLANEASLKFFLFGSVSVTVMLYGMSLLFGATGTLNLQEMARRLPQADLSIVVLGLALTLAGYGFKISMAPFHVWVADTYQGAPTPVTALLSIGPKAAGLAVLLRTLAVAVPPDETNWPAAVAAMAALTMTVGNVLALRQTNIKRLLAYSSIGQAGFLLMGVAAAGRDELSVPALLFYLVAYLAMNMGAFGVATAVERGSGSVELGGYDGLGSRAPWLAGTLTLFLLSLAGMPPLAGFIGKTMLFGAAMGAGFAWLAAVAAANSALSLYYYLLPIARMYLQPPNGSMPFRTAPALALAIGLSVAATVLVGVLPEPVVSLARSGARLFVG
ncbi:MAG: NADH-quinone oxidoreductase subunit N [Chloroflexi bacterium]|nr:NADH-quinone oxidoreductase subunit N [Chloroflexota bacterium]